MPFDIKGLASQKANPLFLLGFWTIDNKALPVYDQNIGYGKGVQRMSTTDCIILLAPLSALLVIMMIGFGIRHFLDQRP
jgi:hypothetical protein